MFGQSAIDFLTTYGFVFLIIAIAISVLYIYVTFPKTIVPAQCTFYGGFTCIDSLYSSLPGGKAQLIVYATDTQPGIINTTSFNAIVGTATSSEGYCLPRYASNGQTMLCVANFTSAAVSMASLYTGTFNISANYCASAVSNLTSTACPATSNFLFGGSIRIQPSNSTLNGITIFHVPIKITNMQNAPTQYNMPQLIEFQPSSLPYSQHETSNLGNIRFYYNGKELQSWCETDCSSSATQNSLFWIKLPVSIPASANVMVDMYFLPYSINYDSYAGEAPNMTCTNPGNPADCAGTYGLHDNGASVFTYYTNFAGNTLPAN